MGFRDAGKASETVAIVPMKPLAQGKTRLSGELSQQQRMALSLNMLRRVLRAITGSAHASGNASSVGSVWVIGGDSEISQVATEEGASWYEEEGADLNETLWLTFQRAFALDSAAMYIPGDLPLVKSSDVNGLLAASGNLKNVTLAPSRLGGGTNGILVLPGMARPFRPHLGPDSFQKHLAHASSNGLSTAIYYSPGLAFDLDTFDDLRAYEYHEPGLLERLSGEGMSDATVVSPS